MTRLAFLGSPEVSASVLDALVRAGHEIAVVVTAPDKRRGRGGALLPTPVKALALSRGLEVSHKTEDAAHVGAELGVVVAYGRIIKPDVLEALPMVNVHFSLLPRWRGAAPVERAILAGDQVTGVSLMAVEEGLDTGPVYATAETEIGEAETADELRSRLGHLGAELLVSRLESGLGEARPQVGEATYANKISKQELELDLSRFAEELQRTVRIGRARTSWRGKVLLVHRAAVDPAGTDGALPGTIERGRVATGRGWLVPLAVQSEGRAPQSFDDWVRGARPQPGERMGSGSFEPAGGTVS